MTLSRQLSFAGHQLWREWKAGELYILAAALLIAISSHTAIGFFADRVEKALELKARDLMGGDLVLKSPRSIPPEWQQEALIRDIKTAETLQFSSVVSSAEDMLLVSVKSVTDLYPLKGQLKTTKVLYGDVEVADHGPSPGEAWVEARVLSVLNIDMGDLIELGSTELKVSRVITFEPDRGGNFYSFASRVMINAADLGRAEIVQPGSRVNYQYLYAGDEKSITDYMAWLKPQLTPSHRLAGIHGERPTVGNALNRAEEYMGLASLVAVLLAAVAIATSAKHYSERHYDTSAILRCLGCQQRDIVVIYTFQLSILALLGGLIGAGLGWFAQFALIQLLGDVLPGQLPAPGIAPFLSGMGISFFVLLGFTLPSIIRLRSVPPLRVLRKHLSPMPLSGWLVYGGALAITVLLMWFYTGSAKLTLGVVLGALLVYALAAVLITLCFYGVEKASHLFSVSVRAGLRNLLRRRQEALGQTMAFGLTFMAMLIVLFIRTELIENWQNALPDDAPNHFVINVLDHEKDIFSEFMQNNKLAVNQLYPVVRGRLTRINSTPVKDIVSKEERNVGALNRELNLTWSNTMQEDNKIITGQWWAANQETKSNLPQLSIESQLAERLSIELGDVLTFFTGQEEWKAQVRSIRSVKWDSFKPNFYVIFEPGALDGLPTTHITSFYLAPENKKLLSKMIEAFPAVTVLEVDAVLDQVKGILTQVTLAIEYILLFVLAAGFSVTFAALKASLESRLHEGALMRTLGAGRKLIHQSQWSEFFGMGVIAGIIAVIGAELVTGFSYHYIFHLAYQPTWWAWLLVPLASAISIGIAGTYSSRQVLAQSPMTVLREL